MVEGFEGHWCLELVPMWSHPHPNPLPKGEGDLDPFVAGSVRGGWAFRRLRQSWIVARGPGWGQAPALHFLLPLSAVNSWFGKIRVLGGAYPGSESGTCFRTDAEDDTFSIDCDGGQERLGEASGYELAWKLFCVGSHRDASISSAGGRPSGVTGG